MTDHKFTDEEIIKALECCRTVDGNDCSTCPYRNKTYEVGLGGCVNDLVTDALVLINRQKAEIERLQAVHADMTESLRLASEANKDMQAEIKRLIKANNRDDLQHKYCNLIGDVLVYSKSLEGYNKFRKPFKAEAIKEFAERLKANMSNIARMEYGGHIYFCVGYDLIDTLVKEMTEGKNESQSTKTVE